MKNFTIALAGNPNCGKTTLFNALTGAKQFVGNWPGVTVERIEGKYKHGDYSFNIIDLPGIYSFSAYSLDEKVAREYILLDKPDLVVNIVDATNLERTLYLTTQLLEMKIPLIVVLNMMDIASQKKINIEIEHLSTHLDCIVVPMVASRKKGIDELKDQINLHVEEHHVPKTKVYYDSIVEESIEKISAASADYAKKNNVDERWLAIKLLENDELAQDLTDNKYSDLVEVEAEKIRKHTHSETGIVIADGRYGFIKGLFRDVVHKDSELRKNISDLIDRLVLNRFLSIPIFLFVMYLVFMLTINVGAPFIDFFDKFVGTIFVDGLRHLLTNLNFPLWLITILADGIGAGIQTVSTFIPPIFFMFFSLSILEDSGYMSRAAFVMDKFMRIIGLPGKAFIPMIVGFGCNVPAIMATRTLENPKDRTLTILINPFMSCGARLPVYTLFASVFFARNAGLLIFLIYLIGIILATLTGLLFKRTIFKGETSTFVMELPPYHIPTFNGIMLHTWRRLKSFIIRAGQVILVVVLLLSFLNSFGTDGSFGNQDSSNSILSHIGRKITPLFNPMGISENNWPATVGLITGIFAKETVVGTLDALYNQLDETIIGEEEFNFWQGIFAAFRAIPNGFGNVDESETDTPASEDKTENSAMKQRFGGVNNAFAYLLFVLIYMPCVAVVATIYNEIGARWAIFSVLYLTTLAWIIATLFYQTSQFLSQPATSFMWIFICFIMIIAFYSYLKIWSRKLEKKNISF
ncbi:MAG: iron transporter FeoB [Candidatus Cloacimonas sp. SDB]|nr:MAG: iron transporter FeoB [Candidatus Cloacimonas sp. SDB]